MIAARAVLWMSLALAIAAGVAGCARNPGDAIVIDADDIAGVVTSSQGAEAGVWVIAETRDLPTRFARSVVTDEAGRYVLPDLPAAKYQLWVRGYGLIDSAKVAAQPGQHLNLTATLAPDAATAAKIYPAIHWFAMMKIPSAEELAGHVPGGVDEYLGLIKNQACMGCHQIGDKATREIPKELGTFADSQQAWLRRMASGQAAFDMMKWTSRLDLINVKYLAEWTNRIAAGELPATKPERPRGIERNVVVTTWDWSDPKAYLHDLISSDRRDPTVNANGPLFGSPELSTDDFPILDPVKNTATTFHAPVRDADTPGEDRIHGAASPYWGDEPIWNSRANAHNPMMDQKGRVWYTARIRAEATPAFCRKGSSLPSARLYPMATNVRQLAVYEPGSGQYTFVDTCFTTHHMAFAEDADNTAWVSGGTVANPVVGWINTKLFDETGDAARSQGWTALVADTNGNGKRDAYTEPGQPLNPRLDARLPQGFYAVMVSPADGSVWGTEVQTYYPGAIVRLNPGSHPPATALAEYYRIPSPGFGPRGADIDRNGVVWVSLGSGHLGEFDRRKCKGPLNGPKQLVEAMCPEGWTLHPLPGPAFVNHPGFSAESSYYTWVDQHDTAGLGANVPIAMGNLSDGLHLFVNGQMLTFTVPYPLGFYAKGVDGRIDDASAGWKGRGLWSSLGTRTPAHLETGKGSKPLAVRFQVRPDPLAH